MTWKTVKLGEVCDFVMGQAPPKRETNKNGIGEPFVKAGEFGSNRPIIREWTTKPLKRGLESDIFICVVGATCGKLNLGTNCAIGRSVAAIRANDSLLNQKFLLFYMSQYVLKLRAASTGAAQTVISKVMLNDITLCLPPLAEQERIVAKLDAAFAAIDQGIALAEKKEAEVEQLKAALLSASLAGDDWKTVKLGEIFDFTNGRSFKKSEWSIKGLPIIRIQNLNDSSANFNHFDGTYDPKIEINTGDLLFSWSGTVGTSFGPHIWNRSKAVLNQHIFKLTLKAEINQKFAYFCLRSITSEIEKGVVGAVGIVHVTKKALLAYKIPLPPLAEQERIVAKLDAAFAELETARTAIAETKANYQALKAAILAQELQPKESEAA